MNRFLVSYLQYLMKVRCKYALVYMEAVLHCMMLVALVVVALVSKNMSFRQHFPVFIFICYQKAMEKQKKMSFNLKQ